MGYEVQALGSYALIHLFESTLWAMGIVAAYFVLPFVRAKHRFLMLQLAMLKFLAPTSLIAALLPRSEILSTPLDALFVTAVSGVTGVALEESMMHSWFFWIAIAWSTGLVAMLALQLKSWKRSGYSDVNALVCDRPYPSQYRDLFEKVGCPLEIVGESQFSSIGVCGIFRPRIVINRAFLETLSNEEIQLALIHEKAHVKRRDNLWRGIHNLIVFAFWFHPIVWILHSKLRLECEHACDEEVLLEEKEPRNYAECLVRAASFVSNGDRLWATSLTDTSLKKRVTKIIAFKIMKESKMKTVALIAFALTFVGVLVSASSTAFAERIEISNQSNTDKVYDLKDVDTYPKAVFQIKPEYPEDLPDEGWATVEWIIDVEGRVFRPRILKSSERGFEEPALNSILKSKWKPGIKDGEAVKVRVRQRMDFNRKGKE